MYSAPEKFGVAPYSLLSAIVVFSVTDYESREISVVSMSNRFSEIFSDNFVIDQMNAKYGRLRNIKTFKIVIHLFCLSQKPSAEWWS